MTYLSVEHAGIEGEALAARPVVVDGRREEGFQIHNILDAVCVTLTGIHGALGSEPAHHMPSHVVPRYKESPQLVPRGGHAHDLLALCIVQKAARDLGPIAFSHE